ncbi:MAG: SDR family oxidoreductase [Chloroflexota bacterium]|nr:SDR family oxidoreductase [Chloroflexota bacterium]
MKLDGCNALITGASAGLGSEFARQLAPRARSIVLVARRVERLQQLQHELTAANPKLQVHVRAADLSNVDEVGALADGLERDRTAVDLLINNAGLGDRGAFVTSDPPRVNDILAVNVIALTMLTRRLLPAMVAAKRGAILNVSSSASFMPMPELGVYAATKAYVTSFSEALRGELRGSGVVVSALCPGPVHTEFDRVARRASDREQRLAPEFTYVSAAKVVRMGLAGIERDRAIVIPGAAMKSAMFVTRLLPMPLLRAAWRFAR